MPRIYISYRRDDTRIPALALHTAINQRFGADAENPTAAARTTAFIDAVDIPLGVNLQRYIDEQIAACDIMLVVIGYNWLGTDALGRAIDSTGDYIRREVEAALAGPKFGAGKTVVPVLVNGAAMPPANKLPVSLQVLTTLPVLSFSDQNPTAAAEALAPVIAAVQSRRETDVVRPSAETIPAPPASASVPPPPQAAVAAPAALQQAPRRGRFTCALLAILFALVLITVGVVLFVQSESVQRLSIDGGTQTALSTLGVTPTQSVPTNPTIPTVDHDPLTVQIIDAVTDYLNDPAHKLVIVGGLIALAVVILLLLVVILPRIRKAAKERSVFLSYQRTSGAMAVAWLSEGLTRQGIKAFYDGEMTGKAGHFPTRLKTEIETRDVFVCVLAESTLQSEWVIQEIRFAYALGKPMIPVFLESYRRADPINDPAIKDLLENQGEHLLDQRGIHLDYSLGSIAAMVKGMPRTRVRRSRPAAAATA